VGKNGHDLWGWACSPLAAQLQPTFEGVVNFDSVCKRGVCLCKENVRNCANEDKGPLVASHHC